MKRRPFKRVLAWTLGAGALGALLLAGSYFYFDRGLPSVEELKHYQPPQVTKVYCPGDVLCGEFYQERRTWVPLSSLPPHVKNAFLAAEDADFYSHEGIDFWGILRAALRSLVPGKRMQGASTISQQACRNLLLTKERTLSRKIREWILTPRMEKALTKDQILGLYLNFIYFGHGRYGIEEAALFYFGKPARALSLGEAAALAGTVQSPHRVNPVSHRARARARQKYVLEQMHTHDFISRAEAEKELEKPLVLGPRPAPMVGEYYLEEVRKSLVARYGEAQVLKGGLRVSVAMDPRLQGMAETAVRDGLEELDRRLGYRGPLGKLSKASFEALLPLLQERIAEAGRRSQEETLVADLQSLASGTPPAPLPEPLAEDEEGAKASELEQRALGVTLVPLKPGVRVVGWVEKLDEARKLAVVHLVSRRAHIPLSRVEWARRVNGGRLGVAPTHIAQVFEVGDLVLLEVESEPSKPGALEASLEQRPEVQGALLVLQPDTRHVVAMVGGYDFALSAFNRAIQARRQPGSSFKPFVYGAALETGKFTPFSIVNDAPEAIRDPWTGKVWKPQNFERGGFEGPMTLRAALTRSKNTVSVRLIEAISPTAVIAFARKAGIQSPLPDNLTLALGTGEVSMLELANAYATLQRLGQYSEPVLIRQVKNAQGQVLEEQTAAFEEVLAPPAAFLTTSLMRSVVEDGTAMAVRELNRPAAGKTGTAQEFRDAWFTGYTADYVASAWVGRDSHEPIGPNETGGRAALPIWLSFMRGAHEEVPVRDFDVPTGITLLRVDPATGLLAGDQVPGRLEPFLSGTEPTSETSASENVNPTDFFLHESLRQGDL